MIDICCAKIYLRQFTSLPQDFIKISRISECVTVEMQLYIWYYEAVVYGHILLLRSAIEYIHAYFKGLILRKYSWHS
jgi:hypothetical protein